MLYITAIYKHNVSQLSSTTCIYLSYWLSRSHGATFGILSWETKQLLSPTKISLQQASQAALVLDDTFLSATEMDGSISWFRLETGWIWF